MSEAEPMISIRYGNDVIIGELLVEEVMTDIQIRQLAESIMPPLEEGRGPHMILDFAKVLYISSSTLGFLVGLKKKIMDRKGQLKLCGINRKVTTAKNDRYIYEILKVVKLDTFFDMYDSVEDALESLSEPTR